MVNSVPMDVHAYGSMRMEEGGRRREEGAGSRKQGAGSREERGGNGGGSEKGTSYMFIHMEQQQLHWCQQSIHLSFVLLVDIE